MSANEKTLQPVELSLPEYIETYGEKIGVPKSLRDSIFQNESNFEHYNRDGSIKISSAGARGVGQLMPGTAKMLGVDPDDPIQNAYGSLKLQKQLYDKYLAAQGDEHQAALLAAAAYNAGEGAVDKYNGIPKYKETQGYVSKVARHLRNHPIKAPRPLSADSEAQIAAPSIVDAPGSRPTSSTAGQPSKAPVVPLPGYRAPLVAQEPSTSPSKGALPLSSVSDAVRTDEFAPAGPEIYAAQQKPSQIDSVLNAAVQRLQQQNAEARRRKELAAKVERARQVLAKSQPQTISKADLEREAYGRTGEMSIGELRRQEEQAVAQSAFQKAKQAQEAGAKALRERPMSAEARMFDPRANVAEQAARTQAAISAEDEWRSRNEPAIQRQTEQYRKQIKNSGGDPLKWLTEVQARGGAGIAEFAAGVASPVSDRAATALRVRAEAAQRAAEEEGADRGEVSKFVQEVSGGFLGTIPELAAMSLGVPAIPTFATAGSIRAAGGGRDVPGGVLHGAATGAAFQIPVAGKGLSQALKKAGVVGAGTTGVELGAGATPREALRAGATNVLIDVLAASIRAGRVRVREGKKVRQATEADIPKIANNEIEVVPPVVEEARQKIADWEKANETVPRETEPKKAPELTPEQLAEREQQFAEAAPEAKRLLQEFVERRKTEDLGEGTKRARLMTDAERDALVQSAMTETFGRMSPEERRLAGEELRRQSPRPAPTEAQPAVKPAELPLTEAESGSASLPEKVASVPFMITRAMESRLKERGFDQDAINKLTPQEANDILAQGQPTGEGVIQPSKTIEKGGKEIDVEPIEDIGAKSETSKPVLSEGEGAAKVAPEPTEQPQKIGKNITETITEKPKRPRKPKPPPVSEVEAAYNAAKAKLDAIGPEPPKPGARMGRLIRKGAPDLNPKDVARWEAENKAHNSWRRKYNALKKAEVEASNALFREKQGEAAPPPAEPEPIALEDLTRSELKQRARREGPRQKEYQDELNRRYETRGLLQFARDYGGYAPSKDLAGEGRRLSAKELGTTGVVNKRAIEEGSERKVTAEMLMEAANEEGFRDLNGRPWDNIGDFLLAIESDVPGKRKLYTKHTENDYIDWDKEIAARDLEQQQQHDIDAKGPLLEEGTETGRIYDRIAEKSATSAEVAEFRRAATEDFGISPEAVNELIRRAPEDVAEAASSFPNIVSDVVRPAQQLGFVEEGLTQQEGPRPKTTDQREALKRAEKERQEAANPERAAAEKTLAEIRSKGMTVDDFERQGSLLGEKPSAEKLALMRELEKGAPPVEPSPQASLLESAPAFVKKAAAIVKAQAEFEAKGGESRGSGGPDTEILIAKIIVKGWEIYSEKVKPTFEQWSDRIRKEFGPESESHLAKIWTQLGGERIESTKESAAMRAKVAEDRALRGEEPPVKGEVVPDEQLLSEAKAANAKDPSQPMEIVDQVINGKKRQLSGTETVQLDLKHQDLQNKYDKINREIGEATDPAKIADLTDKAAGMERAMRLIEEADDVAGSEQGRAFRARRLRIDEDLSALRLAAMRTESTGKPLTPRERKLIQEQAEEIARLKREFAESRDQDEKAAAERAVNKIKSQVVRENRRIGRRTRRASLDAEAVELKELIAQAWMKNRGGGGEIHSAMGLAKLDPEGVVTKLVVQLARNRVEAHIGLKAEALVDEVHGMLKDVVDLNRRDVSEMISGYGKTFEMSQDAVDIRLRELKSIIASNLGKADIIEKGIRPLRRGLQRDKPSQEVREAMRDLRDTLREHGMRVERLKGSPEEQQKSNLDAAKTRTRNRIEDLNKWISDGKRTVANKTEIIPDAELNALRGERDRLEKIFEAIDDPAADARKIENAIKSAEKSVADLEAKIRSGDIAVKPREVGQTSAKLDAVRAEQKALRGIISDLRAAAKPKPTDVEAEARKLLSAQKSLQTRMEKQIADFERRIKQGDFSKPPKRQPAPISRETLALQKQLEQVKQDYFKANYKATRGRFGVISDELTKAANVPKTIKSMGDISAMFRQGGFYALTHPKAGLVEPTKKMVQSFAEVGHENVKQIIQHDPAYAELKRAGTEFTDVPHGSKTAERSEEYMGSETIDTISQGKYNPLQYLVKKPKDFSERTFNSFLDAQRLYVGKAMIKGLLEPNIIRRTLGQKPIKRGTAEYEAELKEISKLLNAGTGRGSLGKYNQAAPFLNIFMFSPRLLASRIRLLNNMVNPYTMATMSTGARNQMMADNAKFIAGTYALLNLAQAAGATVEWDTDSSDFLKIRIGNTSYDTLTGLQQPFRYIINMVRAMTGDEHYAGKGAFEQTVGTPTGGGGFARSKASPTVGAVVDLATGVDFLGRKVVPWKTVGGLIVPLPFGDFWQAMKTEGLVTGPIKAVPSLTGIGVTSYPRKPEKPTTDAEKLARKLWIQTLPVKEARDEAEVEVSTKKAELKARARKGEDVRAELDKLDLTKAQKELILDAKGKTLLEQDFNHLGLEDAVTVYETMTPTEREQTRKMMSHKKKELLKKLSPAKQQEIRKRLEKLGFAPKAPQLDVSDVRRYFPSKSAQL